MRRGVGKGGKGGRGSVLEVVNVRAIHLHDANELYAANTTQQGAHMRPRGGGREVGGGAQHLVHKADVAVDAGAVVDDKRRENGGECQSVNEFLRGHALGVVWSAWVRGGGKG